MSRKRKKRIRPNDEQAVYDIVHPIVLGQLRHFRNEHPGVLDGKWIGSIEKRISCDIASRDKVMRLRDALLLRDDGVSGQTENGGLPCPGDPVDAPKMLIGFGPEIRKRLTWRKWFGARFQ